MENQHKWSSGVSVHDIVSFKPETISDSDAWVGHLHFDNYIIQKVKPKIFVELGVYTGNSYLAFCQSIEQFKLETQAFGIDSWAGDIHMGPQDPRIFRDISERNGKYSRFSRLIKKNFDDAISDFSDRSIDLLHIDGTHTYAAVKNDFKSWLPKLSDNATVLFHDTNVVKSDFGVKQFWNEVKSKYSNMEFKHSNGLGVLQMPNIESTKQLPFTSVEETTAMQVFFEALGENELQLFRQGEELKQLDNRLQSAIQRIAELELERELVFSSYSWRLSAPLRALGSRIRR